MRWLNRNIWLGNGEDSEETGGQGWARQIHIFSSRFASSRLASPRLVSPRLVSPRFASLRSNSASFSCCCWCRVLESPCFHFCLSSAFQLNHTNPVPWSLYPIQPVTPIPCLSSLLALSNQTSPILSLVFVLSFHVQSHTTTTIDIFGFLFPSLSFPYKPESLLTLTSSFRLVC